MATIPIEIILQDAEAPVDPTPTPESETNIIVPDTGAGMVGSNNTSSSSSVASIILPTILLVVALVTICTVLIHKHHKHQDNNNKTTKKEKLITIASTTTAVLSATVLVGNLVIPATNAATSVAPGTAELETEDKITIIATREQDSDTITATVKDTSYATANLDFGYKVTASMAEGLDSANLYLDGDETSEYYIAPAEDGVLANNTWGYTLEEPSEDTTYLSIPLANDPTTIVKGNSEIEDELVDIYYTIKVDKSLPVGTYTGELEYILTDNNFPSTLTTMQGMTTEICENTFTPGNQVTDPVPTATLEDIRDHKTYTIAKLADGNCWMTQNLDLDLSAEVTLTPDDTNILANWAPENSTIAKDDLSSTTWPNNTQASYDPYSYDPGDMYYYSSGTTSDDEQYDSLLDCQETHPDCSKRNHVGNYYSWSAVVARNDTSGMTEQYYNAPDSICPAGWRLAKTIGNDNTTTESEFGSMLASEGIITDPVGWNDYATGGFDKIRTTPLWLIRSGYVAYGSLKSVGGEGDYWSSAASGDKHAYVVSFGSSYVYPPNSNDRSRGYPIRCLAE